MTKIKFKFCIEDGGEKLYGTGPNELIKQIKKEGSLAKAAGQINMSYKKGPGLVQRLNDETEDFLNNNENRWTT